MSIAAVFAAAFIMSVLAVPGESMSQTGTCACAGSRTGRSDTPGFPAVYSHAEG